MSGPGAATTRCWLGRRARVPGDSMRTATGGDRLAAADRGRTAQRREAAGTDPRLLGCGRLGIHLSRAAPPAGSPGRPHTTGTAAAPPGRSRTQPESPRPAGSNPVPVRGAANSASTHPGSTARRGAGSPSPPPAGSAPHDRNRRCPLGRRVGPTHSRNRRGPPGCRSAPHGRNRRSPGTTPCPSGAPQTRHPPHPGSATHRLPPHTTGTTAARRNVADRNFRPAGHRPPPNHDRRAALKPLSLPPLPRTPPPPRAACGSRPATSSPAAGTLPPR